MSNFDLNTCFTKFKTDVSVINLPKKFTFPFYYQPHEIAVLAANELQILIQEKTWNHNFDTNLPEEKAAGKMFGVLVVKNAKGKLGYLSAFSGKMGNQVALNGFVPPIFNRLKANGYYLAGEEELNQINRKVWALEKNAVFKSWKDLLVKETTYSSVVINTEKQSIKENKNLRKNIRDNQELTSTLTQRLGQKSIHDQLRFKRIKKFWKGRLTFIQSKCDEFQNEIDRFKNQRKAMSISLQKKLFSDYKFLDANMNLKHFGTSLKILQHEFHLQELEIVAHLNYYNLLINKNLSRLLLQSSGGVFLQIPSLESIITFILLVAVNVNQYWGICLKV